MSSTEKVSGNCLCGAVEIEAEINPADVGVCHCSKCRQWGGGPFHTIEGKGKITISGSDKVRRFESSDWAERAFCSQCGSHLFYRLKQTDTHYFPVGIFDNAPGWQFDHQIFIEEKPDYYEFGNDTRKMTGAEVFAQFTENSD